MIDTIFADADILPPDTPFSPVDILIALSPPRLLSMRRPSPIDAAARRACSIAATLIIFRFFADADTACIAALRYCRLMPATRCRFDYFSPRHAFISAVVRYY